MKTIGLIGATSFGGNSRYIEVINKTVMHLLGGQHTASCVHYTFDFHETERLLAAARWDTLRELTVRAAKSLERDGADFLVLCSNAMHKLLPDIEAAVRIPALHLVEVVADELHDNEIETVGVLGTRYTMTQDFFKPILLRRGISPIVPTCDEVERVHSIIFNELCYGVVTSRSKLEVLRVIDALCERGAEGVVLACTEICLLLRQSDTEIPLFDTQLIHAERAAKLAIS